jgi:hypothetical protein
MVPDATLPSVDIKNPQRSFFSLRSILAAFQADMDCSDLIQQRDKAHPVLNLTQAANETVGKAPAPASKGGLRNLETNHLRSVIDLEITTMTMILEGHPRTLAGNFGNQAKGNLLHHPGNTIRCIKLRGI